MKLISKFLYILLGFIIFSCVVILLCAKNPTLAGSFSDMAGKISKGSRDKASIPTSDDYVSEADIEALLLQIEQRANNNAASASKNTDLGLVSKSVYESLDDYYIDLARLIRDNYKSGAALMFKMRLSDEIFPAWYESNVTDRSAGTDSTFSFNVDYEKEEEHYLISHTVIFD